MADEGLGEIGKKLDVLIALVAVDVLRGKTQTDSIKALSQAGLGTRDIATLVGATSNAVRGRLSEMRRKGKKTTK